MFESVFVMLRMACVSFVPGLRVHWWLFFQVPYFFIQMTVINFFCSPHGIKERTNKLVLVNSLSDPEVAYGNVRIKIHNKSDSSGIAQHVGNNVYSATV